jgi:circadian clock protein KaiC
MAGRRKTTKSGERIAKIPKIPSGIRGLDEITGGGLPKGRPTLISGGPGCGKTLFAMEFVARGIQDYHEPGVFVAFEEKIEDLKQNFRSLGFDLEDLARKKLLALDHIYIERSEIEEAGEYDLEGLFVRLGAAIDSVKAKRIAIDTIEALFSGFSNDAILRAELRRLFRWLKDRGITAVITAERGDATITRHGLEEYVADCVITLDHRVVNQIATRRLRVVKYRGSSHGTDEYPFLIGNEGVSVLPISSLSLNHGAPVERISSGIPRLDTMLGGKGYYRGSSVLVSGQAGTGKTSVIAAAVNAACRRGEKCVFLLFEESENQVMRNMRSIGIDLEPWVKKGLLRFSAVRPTAYSLEKHLAMIFGMLREFRPEVLAIDPISNLYPVGDDLQVRSMLMRLIDYAKTKEITGFFTSLSSDSFITPFSLEPTSAHVSSLMDTWISLKNVEGSGERNRTLSIIKSRGMAHSHQLREFVLTDGGFDLLDVYQGSEGVLFGSARAAQESREKAAQVARKEEIDRMRRDLERKRKILEADVAAIRDRFAREEEEVGLLINHDISREETLEHERKEMAALRKADE